MKDPAAEHSPGVRRRPGARAARRRRGAPRIFSVPAHAVLRPRGAARLRISAAAAAASATGCIASARINSAARSSLARYFRVQPGDAASSRRPYAGPDVYANVRTSFPLLPRRSAHRRQAASSGCRSGARRQGAHGDSRGGKLIDNTDRSFRAHIQIVSRQIGRIEGLAILDAEIAAMTIPRSPAARFSGHVASPPTTTVSRAGFAASPGTAVLPTCSMRIATSDTTGQIRTRSFSNRRGHSSS